MFRWWNGAQRFFSFFFIFFSIKNNFDYFLFCMIYIAITFYLLFWIFPVFKFNFFIVYWHFNYLLIAQYNLIWLFICFLLFVEWINEKFSKMKNEKFFTGIRQQNLFPNTVKFMLRTNSCYFVHFGVTGIIILRKVDGLSDGLSSIEFMLRTNSCYVLGFSLHGLLFICQ